MGVAVRSFDPIRRSNPWLLPVDNKHGQN